MNKPKFTLEKEKHKMEFKDLVGKKMPKNIKFMGEDVKINKLSVSEVMTIQERARTVSENDNEGFSILKLVIRSAVVGAEEITDEDFDKFPMDELSKLSAEIMKFSGLSGEEGKSK